jgi:hypothetical protein
LNEAEARRLIEQPIRDFVLVYDRIASQRILDLTRFQVEVIRRWFTQS